jgi:gluconolactonase
MSPAELFVSGFVTPEGPAFDRDGNLFFVNWEESSIVKATPNGETSEFFNTGGIPAGLAFHPDGSLYVADEGEQIHGVLRIDQSGHAATVVDAYQGVPLNGANDLVFDRNGVLYFSDPWGTNAENPAGGFYRLLPSGELQQIDSGLAFPNGVALNADESAVYLAETYRHRILRYQLRLDGTFGPREHWADIEPPPGPDGMAFDDQGNLYVAHYAGGRIDVFDPEGRPLEAIPVPGSQPTNVAFGGEGNRMLYVTEVETHAVYRVRVEAAGLPLNDGRSYG